MSRITITPAGNRLRQFTGLAMVAAASLRSRAVRTPVAPAPVPQIATNPEKQAETALMRAFEALKQADAGATEAQLFCKLRLMMNRLENGGLRTASTSSTLTKPPVASVEPPIAPTRRRDRLMTSLRDRSRSLGRALLGN